MSASLPAIRDTPSASAARWARWRAGDFAALAYTAAFLGWIAFEWGGEQLAAAIDFAAFLPLGLVVGWLQLHVAGEVGDARDRLAWRLLAAASFSRFVSGNLWSALLLTGRAGTLPVWLTALIALHAVFSSAALLAFPSAPRRRADRRRFVLDALVVLVGSILLVWYLAIEPNLLGKPQVTLSDYVNTAGDSLAIVLAAVLYLRSGSPLTRSVALLLLISHLLHVVPDAWLTGRHLATFHPGDWIDIAFFSVWALKYVAARRALTTLGTPTSVGPDATEGYVSGALPYLFVAAVPGVLLIQLALGLTETSLFTLGSGVMAALLVARQIVELREYERLDEVRLGRMAWHRTVLDHAYNVLVLVDGDGQVSYASPASERLFSVAPGKKAVSELFSALHPDDRARATDLLAQHPFAPTLLLLRIESRDGGRHELQARFQDLRDDPLVASVVINGHDITREVELAQQIQAAKEAEALGVFAGGLAHDLNNFLTVVGSHVELLRAEVPASRPEALADLQTIQEATNRTFAVTNALLTLSRRKQESFELVNVGRLVHDSLESAGLDASHLAQDERLVVRADAASLRHALDVLLSEHLVARPSNIRASVGLAVETLDAADAGRLELAPGHFIVVRVGAAHDDGVPHSRFAIPQLADNWETSPGDLGTLLVHVAVREIGGAVAAGEAGGQACTAIFLPSAFA
ncbi:MAG: hypothetical protein HY084_03520 [Gemmatimonadetes bacterium]|nr:hypothetical protein [Gemmatimonadota bacterium]